MTKRLRDLKKWMKPLARVSFAEWEEITDRYNRAKYFLDEKNPAYQIMLVDLEKVRSEILENRVHEVRDEKTISDTLKKIFITPKEEQLNELVGQYKYITDYLAELRRWVERKEAMEKMEAAGRLTIDRDNSL